MSFLDRIERLGNRLPHPAMLFISLCIIIPLLSWLCAAVGVSAVHPVSGEVIRSINLISAHGLHRVLAETVKNFIEFAPVGIVLVAMLGFGIAEESGFLPTMLRAVILRAPPALLSFSVVLAGVLSSLAADVGYVVLIPLAGTLFLAAGRHPIAGITAAFAGVSGGFSANLLIGPLDPLLAGISTAAMQPVNPGYEVSATSNYFFMLASTPLVTLIGTWVTERIVEPRLGTYHPEKKFSSLPKNSRTTDADRRGLRHAGWFSLGFALLLLVGLWPGTGVLLDAGDFASSPFIKGIVVILTLYAGLAGWVFGRASGRFTREYGAIHSMEKSMRAMAGYIVLMFFAAQAVNYFNWTNLGLISAIFGAEWLRSLELSTVVVLIAFTLLAATTNLLIGSSSAKWTLVAPVFVPMFYLAGITPEMTQAAYRIGDSVTNVLTPLMPYFALVATFLYRYDKQAGIGTLLAAMLPYTVALGIGWLTLFGIWLILGFPLGI